MDAGVLALGAICALFVPGRARQAEMAAASRAAGEADRVVAPPVAEPVAEPLAA